MKYSENALNILAAKSYRGIGNAWIVRNLKGNESVERIVSLLNKAAKEPPTTVEKFERLKERLKQELLDKFERYCDGIVAVGDPDFPEHRGSVKDSERPVLLYYKGNLSLLRSSNINITVIGLLNPEDDIKKRERKIVREFINKGATIVSGLALGCDSVAHEESLNSNGYTIAILPSPLDNILPASNRKLAAQIVEAGGLLISEYEREFRNKMELFSRYKERDRLQALFCDAIVLVASYAEDSAERWNLGGKKLDSGARLAMKYAESYKIPRVVMYDENTDENNPMFDLNRKLIKEAKGKITIINRDNALETIDKIINRIRSAKEQGKQEMLFN